MTFLFRDLLTFSRLGQKSTFSSSFFGRIERFTGLYKNFFWKYATFHQFAQLKSWVTLKHKLWFSKILWTLLLVLFFIEWSFSINCFLSNHIDYQVVNNEWTEYNQYKTVMSLGYQIWVGKQKCDGHNLPLLIGI